MKFLIQFVLASCFLIIIGETAGSVGDIEKAVKKFIKDNGEHTSCAYKSLYFSTFDYHLFLRKEAKISENGWSLYWKAVNDEDIVLTVKINTNAKDMTQEAKILEYLKAQNPNVEEYGVPKIYFSGSVMTAYRANAMTLFHGSFIDVQKRYKKEKLKLSDLSLLILLKGAVKTLKFLSEHNVVHNNIQPENIFVYGDKIFLCNFEFATGPGDEPHLVAYPPVASSSWHKSMDTGVLVPRTPRDDFESLIFSIWTVAGMPKDPTDPDGKPEAYILSEFQNRADAKPRFMERCNYFKDKDAQKAFKELVNEMLCDCSVPNYNQIFAILDSAISTIEGKSKPERIDWMGRGTDAAPSKKSKYSKLMSGLGKSVRR